MTLSELEEFLPEIGYSYDDFFVELNDNIGARSMADAMSEPFYRLLALLSDQDQALILKKLRRPPTPAETDDDDEEMDRFHEWIYDVIATIAQRLSPEKVAQHRQKKTKKELAIESAEIISKVLCEAPAADFNDDGELIGYTELPGEDLGRYTLDALTKFSKKADPEYKKKLQAEIEKRTSGGLAYRDLPKKLKHGFKGEVTEHEDGSISVDGDVSLDFCDLTSIPIKFRRVSGQFNCSWNDLTSLENAPDFVGGDFWCHHNRLTSLEGLGEVRGAIVCEANLVPEEELLADYRRKRAKKDLVGESKDPIAKILHEAPIVTDFDDAGIPTEYKEVPDEDLGKYSLDALVRFSKKTSPKYKKKIQAEIKKRRSGNLTYRDLPEKLKYWLKGTVTEHSDGSISVDGRVGWFDQKLIKIPIKFRRVTGDFECTNNRLMSLENAPDWVGGDFWCFDNKLTSLDGLGEVQGGIYCAGNPILEEKLLADYRQKRAKKELAEESLAIERLLK